MILSRVFFKLIKNRNICNLQLIITADILADSVERDLCWWRTLQIIFLSSALMMTKFVDFITPIFWFQQNDSFSSKILSTSFSASELQYL